MTINALTRSQAGEKWNRDEHVLAFNLYCKIPFGAIHARNPKIIQLANLLGRSANSVSLKLSNFARLDPALQMRGIKGMQHGAKGEEEIWNEFVSKPEILAFEGERLLAERMDKSIEEIADIDKSDLPPVGLEREALVRVRVNQNFFRSRILSAYNYQCCVTGLTFSPLLVASHIMPWSEDQANRLNPRNGLCLNALHDRTFDRHLMWIEDDFTVKFSSDLMELKQHNDSTLKWLTSFYGKRLIFPDCFSPDPELLRRHAGRCQKIKA